MFELPPFSLTISLFLYGYGVFMLFYILQSLFNVYHLIRYGVYGFGLYFLVTIFTGGTILLMAGSALLLVQYDWSEPISVNAIIQEYDRDLFPNL